MSASAAASDFELLCFSYVEIKRATEEFSEQNLLGGGRSGKVYCGNICEDRYEDVVAVKRFHNESEITLQEEEIDMLSSIRHPNVVSLIGYCNELDKKILVYEFMLNGTLYDYLFKHRKDQSSSLTVEQRLEICVGVAEGVNYLHSDTNFNSMNHGNVSSHNILLDANLVAKIGLSTTRAPQFLGYLQELINNAKAVNITAVLGYLAPECYETNYEICQKADVYSFGVLLLELLCERPAWKSLTVLALPFIMVNQLPPFTPQHVKTKISPKCLRTCANLVMACLDNDPDKRPSMDQVIEELLLALTQLPHQNIILTISWRTCEEFSLQDIKMATNDFAMYNLLGGGAFWKSYSAYIYGQRYTGVVSVKRINKEAEHGNAAFQQEVQLLASCNHVNIIHLVGYCDEENENIIVYEFMPNGSLYDRLYSDGDNGRLVTVEQRLNICIGVAEGLIYLINRDIFHRNLSTENILLDRYMVPSISGVEYSFCTQPFCTQPASSFSSKLIMDYKQGTEAYIAPECYKPNYEPGPKSDVYAFGILLLEVLCEKPHWKSLAGLVLEFAMERRFKHKHIEINISSKCLRACENLIRDCLDFDPGKRPSMNQVMDELRLALKMQMYGKAGNFHQFIQLNKQSSATACKKFLLGDLKKATNDFSNHLGEGAFGKVYGGSISENSFYNGPVAVKRMSMEPELGIPAFKKEIELVSACNHVNIISLLGFCEEEDERILVYEYMPNGSLYDYLYTEKDRVARLSIVERLKILIGVAKGLDYLHSHTDPVIIHSDLKTDNILLDQELVPKISDFGLSRTRDAGPSTSKQTTNHIKGTEGYIAPECYEPKYQLSRKADVYAYGVVLLEVLCERPAWQRLVILALPFILRGELPNFTPDYVSKNISSRCSRACEHLIEECLDTDPIKRPDMSQVVTKLQEALRQEEKCWKDNVESLALSQPFWMDLE